jgi:hypothetical protein
MSQNRALAHHNIFVWVSPPDTKIPLTTSPIRFAVGTPTGRSSNSWKVWTTGHDAYIACRDNFREFKVSLHASGIRRVAFTQEAVRARPELALPSGNRVIQKYTPDQTERSAPLLAFQIVVLKAGLYLGPNSRRAWRKPVLFVEPADAPNEMTVLSVMVTPGGAELRLPTPTRGGVVGILPLGSDRSIQLVATYELDHVMRTLVQDAFLLVSGRVQVDPPPGAVIVLHGQRPEGTPWLTALKHSDLASGRF